MSKIGGQIGPVEVGRRVFSSGCESKRVVQSELKDSLETASADDEAAPAEIKESRPVKQKTLGMPFTLFVITGTIDTLVRMRYRWRIYLVSHGTHSRCCSQAPLYFVTDQGSERERLVTS